MINLKRVANITGLFLATIMLLGCATENGPVVFSDDHQVNTFAPIENSAPLSNQVRAALKASARTRYQQISVGQDNEDTVKLSGTVNDSALTFEAERIAYTVTGVRFVVNNLIVPRN